MEKASFITKNVLLTVYSLLSILVIFVLSYLLVLHLDENATCAAQVFGDCGVINKSEYSVILGVPVALLGILWTGFGVVMALIKVKFTESQLLTLGLIVNGAVSIIFSIYLIFIEAFVINEWCQYCLLTDVLILLAFIATLFIFILERNEERLPVKQAEKLNTADVAQ